MVDIRAVRKREGIRGVPSKNVSIRSHGKDKSSQGGVLYKIENRDPVAYGRKQAGAIRCKEQIALVVDCSQEIGELVKIKENMLALAKNSLIVTRQFTLKSVFIFLLRQLETLPQKFDRRTAA